MGDVQQLLAYLKDRNVTNCSQEWCEWILSQNSGSHEQIYHKWLDQDWTKLDGKYFVPSLPQELNADLINFEKKTYNAKWILQVDTFNVSMCLHNMLSHLDKPIS